MVVFPAIDIRGGNCVRLYQGDFNKETIFSNNPEEMAQQWEIEGAKYLHIVDLDGARAGSPVNIFTIKKIIETVNIPIEVGGGIRTLDDIYDLLEMGVDRVILGSAAVDNPNLVKQAAREFEEGVIVGIDAKNGKVAVHGWDDTSEITSTELAMRMGDAGIMTIIFTDISRDGTLGGVQAERFANIAIRSGISVIASGGVGSIDDIKALKKYEDDGVIGVILGKSIYTGALSLSEAIAVAEAGGDA
ncbi:MAG: 1-(5-phosphoribosyl)-5-[Selenomonadaceae bacterium]|nr:1-(5-phosphoribosyl)-5-[(5-phosphoribosylamino)methylideneamino]imidazole-4-carboxamide isomerase [Selenomonadaceae bacterium]MBR1857960.1 1-(5-phosphoribosyl)-5-[(5-phosphoribosylamino)methylideneamino]imidazole-4-carboxamide isomerase [Selenomonadaceae bacterium]